MIGIDPKTVLLMTGSLGMVMALVLYLLKRSYPPTIRGIGLWATSMVMSFVAGGLFSTANTLPAFLSISLPSTLVFSAPYVSYVGTQRFYDVAPRHLPWLGLILLAIATSAWFTYGDPNYARRLQLSSIIMITLSFAHARLIWLGGGKTMAGRIALCVLICGGAIQAMRFVTAVLYPVGINVMDASPENVIYLASFSFAIVLISISQVLLASDRLRGELQHAATHDSLTNAFTRRYLHEAIQRELARCLRHNRSMSLMLLDIDHFKSINDSMGHLEGDRILTEFVGHINNVLRRGDLMGRFGGEEFVVLLPETAGDVAKMAAERVRTAVEGLGGPTVSIGVTSSLANGDSVDAMLKRADNAMYRAKSKGRNRVEVN